MSQIASQVTKDILQKNLLGGEVTALNSLLCGEISAVETYNQAIQQVKDISLIPTLEDCRNSHAIRVARLKERINQLGASSSDDSGLWGTVTGMVEGAAALFGDRAVVAVLAGGEEYGTQQYNDNIEQLDSQSRKVVRKELLPAQKATQHLASRLNATVH